ncbi:ABC transporter ATP-binding protein [Apilactobacillus micheneri]|uniref:ATP-binding cassette domain-containing protein n=1 Tax=Apilactobacillus micheneri TaxID=1899430 RepID=UPI00112954C4|nr:ABC transporter ATP-binding protein [Apilactobacillus micheneri]TPR42301.1 ABC transporter ATP-binding protein [Apilactobacillus micheneri]TPR47001.1 ABC transporter ATP-binding protein [Apilactobacillus micheneri]
MDFKNLSYKFKGQKEYLLNNISFSLIENNINFLIGENGSGKTTLIDSILGLRKSDINQTIKKKNYIYINQMLPMLDSIRVMDVASLILGISNGKLHLSIKNLKDYVDTYTYNFLKNNWNKYYYELSGGNQKLLQLLLFLQVDKKYVILDEPTAFLDRENAIKLFNVVKHKKNRTYMIVTHDIRDLRMFEDYQILLLDNKKIKLKIKKREFVDENYESKFLKYFTKY